jgi:hypothetical protein
MLLRESCRRNEGLSDDICFVLNEQKFISTYISVKLKSKKLSLILLHYLYGEIFKIGKHRSPFFAYSK